MLSKRVVGVAVLLIAVIIAVVAWYLIKPTKTQQATPTKQSTIEKPTFKVDYNHNEKPASTQ